MLDAKSERAVAGIAEELRALFGAELVSAAVYGSAANRDFVPGRSDINVIVVLDRLSMAPLRALRERLPQWRQQGIATPLLVDRAFLRDAADVFPMEFYDIRHHHRLLAGEDVLESLAIDSRHLRYQCEHEVRGKLLRLHEMYLEAEGRREALRALMLDSVKTFLLIMRHMNRLRGSDGLTQAAALAEFERLFGCVFPTVAKLLELGRSDWQGDEEEIFASYWQELQQLAAVVDHLPDPAASDTPGK